jgi:putative transposase
VALVSAASVRGSKKVSNKNAVLTQILAAFCVYLFISFIKYRSKLLQSVQQIARLLHTNLFSKRDLMGLFHKAKPDNHSPRQMPPALARR